MNELKNHKERALKKLKNEINSNIDIVENFSKLCGIWEFLRLGYLLHLVRLQTHIKDRRESLNHAELISMHLMDEAIKYAISHIACHAHWRTSLSEVGRDGSLDNDLINSILKITQHINALHEHEALIQIADVSVSGERDQDCTIDLESIRNVPERARMISYGYRLEAVTFLNKNASLDAEQFLEKFRNDYSDIDDLFQIETGLSLDEYCDGLNRLIKFTQKRLQAAEPTYATLSNGNIDVLHPQTFYELSRTFIIEEDEINQTVGTNFTAYMRRNQFSKEEVNNSELRFHYLSRKPYFFGEGFAVIFPELILDSIFTHTHFSLLESLESKPAYIERRSKWFVDQIAEIATLHGFIETGRDIYLKKGKKDYGDIDLVLQQKTSGKYILIEAKNHALPLDVFFRSHAHTQDHLKRTKDWEKKVLGRLEYLENFGKEVGITEPYKYLIVSLHPEILSHASSVLTLSIDEFDSWMSTGCSSENFNDFYKNHYQSGIPSISEEDMQQLHADGFALARPVR